jgi:scyllo-inositol 2-dehydrogenase (NADP+)
MADLRRVRVGLVGTGWVSSARHLPAFRGHPEVDVVAAYDRHSERTLAFARSAQERGRCPIQVCRSLDELLGLGLDIVSVATSPWSHAEVAEAAFAAGTHVFTEKPMAMCHPDAVAMVDSARSAGRLLCVSHNFLFSRSLNEADAKLAGTSVDYAMGVQASAETRRLPTWYRDLPGGLMFDEAPHLLYTMQHYLGGGLQLDHARATFDDDGHPRTVEVLLRGATGHGQVTMVFCAPVSEWHVMLSSKRAVVGLDLFRDIAVVVPPDGAHRAKDIARTSVSVLGGHVRGFARSGVRLCGGRQFWGHDRLIAAFVDATLGRREAPVELDAALEVVGVTDSILEVLGLRGAIV